MPDKNNFDLPPLPDLPKIDPLPPVTPKARPSIDDPLPTSKPRPSIDDPLSTPKARPSIDDPLPMVKPRPSIDDPLPAPKPRPSLDDGLPEQTAKTAPETHASKPKEDPDLPPVMEADTPSAAPIAAPMKKDDDFEEYIVSEDAEPDPEPVLEDMSSQPRLAPMATNRTSSQKAMREKIRMSDLQSEMEAPKLEDLSDEYKDPRTKAKDLANMDKLDRDEKDALRRRVKEDLAHVPESYNARRSQKMYNKLMEEKQLKIAKKGFVISIIPIALGLLGAAISFFELGWDEYEQIFQVIGLFGAAGSLLLLIKSKQSRLFGMSMFALSLVAYVGLGLFYYLYETVNGRTSYDFLHLLLGVAASGCNIAALLVLIKNEAVNVYYNTKFSRKRD